MGRRSRQQERRAELVAAARAAVVERGVAALRLSDVTSRVGMAPSTLFYYFPGLPELLREVAQEAVERFCAARAQVVAGVPDPRRRLAMMIKAGLPTGPDDELCRLLYELGSISHRDSVHAARHVALFERQVGLYVGILEGGAAAGVFDLVEDSTAIARTLVLLEDGLGLHVVMAVPTFTVAAAEELIRRYAARATRCELDDL